MQEERAIIREDKVHSEILRFHKYKTMPEYDWKNEIRGSP